MSSGVHQKYKPIDQMLLSLARTGTVLHIGAHPDDEDTGIIAYLSLRHNVRTVYWSATRGEGGQNRLNDYRGISLGIYRSWESENARELDGGECIYGPFYDFGYSKTYQQTLDRWGEEALIREIVRAIRYVQPDIIICRWTGESDDGHGHHQAVGICTLEAFKAAADPSRFPELVAQGLPAWQALKYYQSIQKDWQVGEKIVLGARQPDLEKQSDIVSVNTGAEVDPHSGLTYQEIAWNSLNKHKTQGMGMIPAPGDYFYYYRLKESLVPPKTKEKTLFDGIHLGLTNLVSAPRAEYKELHELLRQVEAESSSAYRQYFEREEHQTLQHLFHGKKLLQQASSLAKLEKRGTAFVDYYLQRQLELFNQTIARVLNLEIECSSSLSRLIPGQKFEILARLWKYGPQSIEDAQFSLHVPEGWNVREIKQNASEQGNQENLEKEIKFEVTVSKDAPITRQYWLKHPAGKYAYQWPEENLIFDSSHDTLLGSSFNLPVITVECQIHKDGESLTLELGPIYRESFLGGNRDVPVVVSPPIAINLDIVKKFIKKIDEEQSLKIHLALMNNHNQPLAGKVTVQLPSHWKAKPNNIPITLKSPKERLVIEFDITIPPNTPAGRHNIEFAVQCQGRDYDVKIVPVRLGGSSGSGDVETVNYLQEILLYEPAQVQIHLVDIKGYPKLKYGYVLGAKDDMPSILASLGYNITLLDSKLLSYETLSHYDAIIVGANAYLLREDLKYNTSRLLQYVEEGGTLIVQYQNYAFQDGNFTPYPFKFTIPHDRVTDETAPVTFLQPDHIFFHLPNKITQENFKDWTHDRGLYFFGEWDKHFQPLLSCADEGEPQKQGGLMVASYGRGSFIYVGYSFFLQIPAGIQGVFPLIANMLAFPAAKILERVDFLEKSNLFNTLTNDQLEIIAALLTERLIEDQEYLCHEGDLGQELYIIYRGQVKVLKKVGHKQETIYTAQKGAVLGELSVLAQVSRTASLQSQGESRVFVLEGEYFRNLLLQHPEISLKVINILIERFVSTDRK